MGSFNDPRIAHCGHEPTEGSPSPLNGERAGVRGEAVRLASRFMESEHLQNWTRVGTMNLPNTCRRLSDSETPLGVAMSIQPRHRDIIAAQFPANFPAGNWGTILWDSSSIDIPTPKGVLETSRSPG